MPKYRAKPIVVRAYQYKGGHLESAPGWVTDLAHTESDYALGTPFKTLERHLVVLTVQGGKMVAIPDDWIVEIGGELYPMNNKTFLKTYEKVEP